LLALSFDVIQLSGLLYLTGGMANPFAMLLLAPIVVSAALLDFKATVYLVLLVAFCAIMITHFYLPLPFSETDFVLPALYLSGLFTALLVSSVFIGFYVWYLADKARQPMRRWRRCSSCWNGTGAPPSLAVWLRLRA
jgi:hypothetical protein